MATTLGHHDYSNTQIREFLSAKNAADVHLSLWDRLKDLFRSDTKRVEVERIFTDLAGKRGGDAVEEKLSRVDALIGMANETDRAKFAVDCQPPEPTGNTASWQFRFMIDGEEIENETIEESLDLQRYHAASMYGMLQQMRAFLHGAPAQQAPALWPLLPVLEGSIKRCLTPPPLNSSELRLMFLDIDARVRDLTAGRGSADPLPKALESILETGAHRLSAEMDSGKMPAQARLRDGVAVDIDAAIPVSLLTGTLDAIEALGRDTGNAGQTFRQDIRCEIYDTPHAAIGGEIGGPGLYPDPAEGLLAARMDDVQKVRDLRVELAIIDEQLSLKGVLSNEKREQLATAGNELRRQIDTLVSSLEEEASQRLLGEVALQSSRDAAILQTLFTRAGQSFLRQALDATLSEHAIRDEDRLQITPGQWLRDLKPTVRVGRREEGRRADEPYAIDVALSVEGTLSEVGYTDGNGQQQTLSLRPGSKVEMQVKAELKLGKLRPISAVVRAHLDPVPPVEKNRPRPSGTALGSMPPKRPSHGDLPVPLRQAIARLPHLPPPRRPQAFHQVLDLLGQSPLNQESAFLAECTPAIAHLSFAEWPRAIAAVMHASGAIAHESDRERFWDSLDDLFADGARRIWQMPKAGDSDVLRHLIEALQVLPNQQARNAYRSIVAPGKGMADTPLARGIEAGIKDKLFG